MEWLSAEACRHVGRGGWTLNLVGFGTGIVLAFGLWCTCGQT